MSWVYKKLGIGNLESALRVRNGLRLLNMKHCMGIVLFGILFYLELPEYRSLINTIEITRLYVLIPFILLVFLSAYLSYISSKVTIRNNEILSHYNFSDAWVFFTIRFVFLLSYEFFFRGVLLFLFLETFSTYTAIGLATLMYFIVHMFDSKKELIGTIPFGILLCILTYLTNSVWYAFLIHLTLSAVYEIMIFYYRTIKTSQL